MKKEYYYVYYSYEEWGRGYIGSRISKVIPSQDKCYFGSFKDKTFKPNKKIIIQEFNTRSEAINAEIILHEFFNVDINPKFANQAKQRSIKFSYRANKEKNFQYKKRDWYHKEYGHVYSFSVTELIEKFSDQKLERGHLSDVALGNRNIHKGWTLLNSRKKIRGSQRNWYHPKHGIYLNMSNRGLCSLFKKEKYYHNMLSKVVKGKIRDHNGWVLYHTVMTKKESLNF
jgi:hypothetical protein